MTTLHKVISTLLILFGLIGGTLGATSYFAKASDLNLVASRLEQKITSDNMMQIQERIWKLEDRYRDKETMRVCENKMPTETFEQYRRMKKQLEALEKKLGL